MAKMVLTAALAALAAATSAQASPDAARLDPGVFSAGGWDTPTLQPARVIRVHVYTCTARSRFAYGYWTAAYLAVARQGALVQCAARTPRGFLCRITRCH
jgi:hypothetical protein